MGWNGMILAVRPIHELQFRNGKHGIASIASAGGIGTAVLFERHRQAGDTLPALFSAVCEIGDFFVVERHNAFCCACT